MTGSVVSEGRLGLKFERIRPKIHRNRFDFPKLSQLSCDLHRTELTITV